MRTVAEFDWSGWQIKISYDPSAANWAQPYQADARRAWGPKGYRRWEGCREVSRAAAEAAARAWVDEIGNAYL